MQKRYAIRWTNQKSGQTGLGDSYATGAEAWLVVDNMNASMERLPGVRYAVEPVDAETEDPR